MIPQQLHNPDFRFAPLPDKKKAPPPEGWRTTNLTWEKITTDNYAVITGYGGLIVLDVDCQQGANMVKFLPETFTVATSDKGDGFRGLHAYFICPEVGKKIILFDGDKHLGEIQSMGQYVVGPGSIHPTGITYEVIKDKSITVITKKQLMDVVSPFAKEETNGNRTSMLREETDEICRRIKERLTLSDVMRSYGMDTSKSPGKCPWHICSNDCFSWDDGKGLWHCFDTDCLRAGNVFQLVMQMENCDFKAAKAKLAKMAGLNEEGKPTAWQQFFDWRENARGELVKIRFVSKRLGDAIMQETDFRTLKGSGRMYRYDAGFYHEDGEEHIKGRCKELLDEEFTNARAKETIGYIQAATYTDMAQIESDSRFINLSNGLFDPIKQELKPHTPDVFSIYQIPITYDPGASCPLWLSVVSDKCPDAETQLVLQEFFGYCFIPRQKYEVALLLYGPPRTMKSTALDVLLRLLGEDNVTNASLQTINEDKFSAAYLFGKKANICADLDAAGLRSTAAFMQIVGGDRITKGRKHEHQFSFYPDAKLIFSCNVIPASSNKDLSFYRRWIILEFAKQTPINGIDTLMRQKLQAELSGILNWALDGLRRLEANNGFSYTKTPEQVKDLYERNSDSINSFLLNCISMVDDGGKLTKREAYAEYANYCNTNKLTRHNQIYFGRIFKENTGCGMSKVNDIPCYVGVAFRGQGSSQTGVDAYA